MQCKSVLKLFWLDGVEYFEIFYGFFCCWKLRMDFVSVYPSASGIKWDNFVLLAGNRLLK